MSNKDKAIQKVIDTALGEVGYLEKSAAAWWADPSIMNSKTAGAGWDNYTKYAYDLDQIPGWFNGKKNGYAWCGCFCDWVFIKALGEENTREITNHSIYGASVGWSADAYQDMGRLVWRNPEPGDQVYFGSDYDNLTHTGLIYDVTDDYIFTVEGNTSLEAGVVPNGGGVFKKRYSRWSSYVCCFGRPDYDAVVFEEEDDEMTQEQFNEMFKAAMAEYRKSLQDNTASQYSEDARKWAVDNGLVKGGSTAEFNGMWRDFMTREQNVTLLYRYHELFDK